MTLVLMAMQRRMGMRFMRSVVTAVGICAIAASAAAQTSHIGKTIELLQSPDDRPCTFFMLKGITQSDPITPGNPWFALPKAHIGYKEMLSFLLIAYSSGKTVNVYTSGATVPECGNAGVRLVSF